MGAAATATDSAEVALSATLLQLPPDVLSIVLSFLDAQQLCLVKRVCRKLNVLTQQGDLWEGLCLDWIRQQERYGFVNGITPLLVLKAFNAPNYCWLYQALWRLKAWPVGIWRRTDHDAQPFGELLCIGWAGRRFVGHMFTPSDENEEQVFEVEVTRQDDGKVLFDTKCVDGVRGARVGVRLSTTTLEIVADRSNQAGRFPSLASPVAALFRPMSRILRVYDRLLDIQPDGRMAAPCRTELQQNLPAVAVQKLKALQGLWVGLYATHGHEILCVRLCDADVPPPPDCSITGLRMEALKVTGDVNVPAGNVSFAFDCSSCVLGAYNGDEQDANSNTINRPIVCFDEEGMRFVNLAARRVAARFEAQGRINRDPRVWAPEWTHAQVLLYEGPEAKFSVLFTYDGLRERHIMDFKPLNLRSPLFHDGSGA